MSRRPHIRALAASALTHSDAIELALRYYYPPALVVQLYYEILSIREHRYNLRQRVRVVSGAAFYTRYPSRWPHDSLAHRALLAGICRGIPAQEFLREWRNGTR